MKTVFYFVTLLCGVGIVFAAFTLLGAAANALGVGSLDDLNAAVKAYPAAEVGHILGSIIVAMLKAEIAKLMFWIHLLT